MFSCVPDGDPSATLTVLGGQQSVTTIVCCVVVIGPRQATAAERQRMADARASLWVR